MKIAVPREVNLDERRVALVPDVTTRLVKAGLDVWVEAGAGKPACFPDAVYAKAGAHILTDPAALWGRANVVLKVRAPRARDGSHEVDLLRPGAMLIGLLNPQDDLALWQRLAARRVTAFAMELMPRVGGAQSMDVLTSQAVVAGYKATLLAASALGKFFPMLTTAAGTIPPARVLVIGAGVAGLEAIATARRLGAVVEAFDIRAAAKDEVQSLGASFVGMTIEEAVATPEGYAREVSEAVRRREHEALMAHVRRADVVIATAQVPGKNAPLLVTADMVELMSPGSVIVDLAAEQGGNCALTEAGKEVIHGGVKILGPLNLPSSLPAHASHMYARNVPAFLQYLLRDGALHLDLIQLAYLAAASLFIVGLRGLASPVTARRGSTLATLGMLIAVTATLWDHAVLNAEMIMAGMAMGAGLGAVAARRVRMTAMPQMVGLLNELGGGASTLVAVGECWRLMAQPAGLPLDTLLTTLLGMLIGAITLTGSLVAFGKLQGVITSAPVIFPLQQSLNGVLLLAFLVGGAYLIHGPLDAAIVLILLGMALLLGVLLVLPVGGADMPVVISLLNAFLGLAASAVGFVFANQVLIIAGALVGASGLILTRIMCQAMNRSLANVLFSGFGSGDRPTGVSVPSGTELRVRAIDADEWAVILAYARSVIIVPGYGMAAAQAQHAVCELAEQLEKRGVDVKYSIHPVAGRMPGHMNVLLAEADVPYSQLYDMEAINPEFEKTDVVLVVGANDTVNPAARHDPASSIFGMPILDVDKARTVIVVKRSLNPGFAGIDNALFYQDKTLMLFGHAREVLTKLVHEIKQLP